MAKSIEERIAATQARAEKTLAALRQKQEWAEARGVAKLTLATVGDALHHKNYGAAVDNAVELVKACEQLLHMAADVAESAE